ncbi:MAG: hypothetical protein QXO54_00350 [Candidatus Methanomethylicaceae archaeon]
MKEKMAIFKLCQGRAPYKGVPSRQERAPLGVGRVTLHKPT